MALPLALLLLLVVVCLYWCCVVKDLLWFLAVNGSGVNRGQTRVSIFRVQQFTQLAGVLPAP